MRYAYIGTSFAGFGGDWSQLVCVSEARQMRVELMGLSSEFPEALVK